MAMNPGFAKYLANKKAGIVSSVKKVVKKKGKKVVKKVSKKMSMKPMMNPSGKNMTTGNLANFLKSKKLA